MLKNVYEGLNARPKVYLSKEYFCEMYRLACLLSFASLFQLYVVVRFWDGILPQFAENMLFIYFLVQRTAIVDLVHPSCWH